MKRSGVVLFVCAMVAAVVMSVAAPAASAPTLITFDEYPNYTYITTQYASRGVTFTGSGVGTINNASVARSDPNYIAPFDYPGKEFSATPIAGSFSSAQARVRLWVGHSGWSTAHTTTLRAFNSAGALVGSSSRGYRSSHNLVAPTTYVEVSLSSNSIVRFDVVDSAGTTSSTNVIADDLEFEQVQPDVTISPNPADFGSLTVGTSRDVDIFIVNSGNAPLGTRSVAVSPGEFTIASTDCGPNNTIAPGAKCTVRVRFTATSTGDFTGSIDVTDNTTAGKHTGRLIAKAVPPGTPTTVPTTTVPDSTPSTTTSTTTRTTGTTTTTSSSTTIPTIVTIPPPTPGATLAVDPAIGPGGFVTIARGTGFPPNEPVTLGWSPGIGIFAATAGPDGTFETQVLVMKHDVLGPRTLVATAGGGAVSASTTFLVVPATVHPSGKDVAQITRVRRFLNR